HFQSTAAAVALVGVGGIGDHLQLAQHKLGDQQLAVEEAGFGDVGDATVNDDAGVEQLGGAAAMGGAEENIQRGEVEHLPLFGPHNQADVAHHQQDDEVGVGGGAGFKSSPAHHQRNQERAHDAKQGAGRGAHQAFVVDPVEADLEEDDQGGNGCADRHRPPRAQVKGAEIGGRRCQSNDQGEADEENVGQSSSGPHYTVSDGAARAGRSA